MQITTHGHCRCCQCTKQGKQALFTNEVVEEAEEDREGAIPMPLKKRVHVVHYVVDYVVDQFTCLTTKEHLQHIWETTVHPRA